MRSPSAKYSAAVAIAASAVALRWALIPWLGADTPWATVIAATAIAVWMGGWQAATVTAVLGFIGIGLVIGRPLGLLPTDHVHAIIGIILYVSTCALIIALGEGMRRSRDAYRHAQERFLRSQEAAIQGYALLKMVRDPTSGISPAGSTGPADGIVDFEFEYINPLGATIAQSTPDRIVGQRVSAVLPGVCSAGLLDAMREVTHDGKPLDLELADTNSNPTVWLRFMIVKVEDGVALSYSDITQTKELALSLQQRAADLQRANAVKSIFLATLSHELRNPLAPIRNGLAILRNRVPQGLNDIHDMMERQMRLATRLIDDLLDASRIDRGRLELHREIVNLETVIAAAIETARPNIEAKSLQLLVHPAARTLYVDADSTRLSQLVANLLNNAAKFTPPNGRIEIWTRAKAEHAVIRIRDTGIGIAPENLTKIFEMFVQLDSSKSQAAAGLGLGLALARELARLHGGDVTAHSAGPDKGSEFRITLPLSAPPSSVPEAPQPALLTQTPRQVLIVDDNVDAATSLGTLLKYRGHLVHTCFDGSTAFEAAVRSPPDVAFIDLNMPHPDGAELATMIRRQPWGGSVKLVALTGMGQPADIERTRVAGFDEHLTKPANPDDLFRAVATLR
jgi:signal transduction histidine kinase/CheY-like chemotaxis protein